MAVVGHTPEYVTTDGHRSYPRAVRETMGSDVKHRTNVYLNNRIEQDHRGIKQRYYPMCGFGNFVSAARFRNYPKLTCMVIFNYLPRIRSYVPSLGNGLTSNLPKSNIDIRYHESYTATYRETYDLRLYLLELRLLDIFPRKKA